MFHCRVGFPAATVPLELFPGAEFDTSESSFSSKASFTRITMSRLNPLDIIWYTAPGLVTDPLTNYLGATVSETGVYAVHVP